MVKVTSKYKRKSTTFPPLNLSPNINAFTSQVTKELRDLQQSPDKNPNLDPKLRKALKSLQENSDIIIIKLANKGGNNVILDKTQYVQ